MKDDTFTFRGAEQARFIHHGPDKRRRGEVFHVSTPFKTLGIVVSNEGRSIRVWDRQTGEELL